MPYGLPNDLDEKKEYTKWMERCVSSVMKKGKVKDKSSAVAICKYQLKKNDYEIGKAELHLSFLLDKISAGNAQELRR